MTVILGHNEFINELTIGFISCSSGLSVRLGEEWEKWGEDENLNPVTP